MPFHVVIGGVEILADTIEEALALAEHVGARGGYSPVTTPKPHGAATPVERFIEYLSRPAQTWQRRFLFLLKEHGGEVVDRDTLCDRLGIDAPSRVKTLGGLYHGISKNAARLSVRVTDIVVRSEQGYAAGPRLLEGTPELPTEDPVSHR